MPLLMEWKTYRIPSWIAKFVPHKPLKPSYLERARRQRAHASAAHNNLTFNWDTSEKTADQIVYEDLAALRARSRQQVRDNDYARKFVELVADNVVGHTGIVLQAQVRTARGGMNKTVNDTLERHWGLWGRRGTCDVTGRLSWVNVQRLVEKTLVQDGEAFIRKVLRGTYGLQLQVIDPAMIDVTYNDIAEGGNKIRMGIEFDRWGAPVAYHVGSKRSITSHGYYRSSADSERVPAKDMIHVFSPDMVGQSRGLPRMATALLRMQMLGKYEEAALVKARAGASNMMFFTSPDDGETVPADGTDSGGNPVMDIEPGVVRYLEPGVSPVPYDPAYPNGEFADFVKSALRGISSGLGVDYSAISGDLEGVNYSSIRAGVLETRETWKAMQRFLIDSFCRPVYEAWVYNALEVQALTTAAGGTLPMTAMPAVYDVRWQGRRWAWVDPLKDMQANQLALEMRATSLSDIIAETGKDPEEVWARIAQDEARMDELGISPGEVMGDIMEDDSDGDE